MADFFCLKTFSLQKWLCFIEIGLGVIFKDPGGRLNKKDGLTRYGDSHVKDKTS